MYGNMRVKTMMASIAQSRGWPMRDDGMGGMMLEIVLPTRRTQVVRMTPTRDADGLEVLFFWSIAVPVNRIPDPWMLLQESVRLSYGDYAVKDGNVIVLTSRMSDYVQADELARVLYYVGLNADELERRIMGPMYDGN